ncbi:MAG: sugar ABC transporter permease [Firmicutes bacterium]|nr:sugar ABC transporter permease [Bacillota bacterium]
MARRGIESSHGNHGVRHLKRTAWLFLLPALSVNVLVILGPSIATVVLAFMDWNGLATPKFIGVSNFASLLKDEVFWSAIYNNARWTLIFLTVPVIMGLIAANLMFMVKRGATVYRTTYFIPVVVATAVSARIWQQSIFHPIAGVAAWLANHGLPFMSADFLGNPKIALYSIAFVDNWHWWGFLAVVFLVAMQQIDPILYQAARVEGANRWQQFRYISFPLIRPTLVFMLLMTIIWSFLVFDFIYILTRGGPGYSTEVLATLTYKRAFYTFQAGQASAVGLTMSLIGGIAIAFYIYLQRKGWEI